jgi:hypothetical protein
MSDPQLPYFDRQVLVDFLGKHGYRTHPKGIIQHRPDEWTLESEGVAYLDLNADAIRKGDVVPNRPIRVKAQKESTAGGMFSRWQLVSADELGPGTKSIALDRELPKNSPSWPDA